MRINKEFFQEYQRPILWLANSFIGKFIFKFEYMGHQLRKGRKIDRITHNSIRYKNTDNSYTEQFFGRNEYALKLAPLVWWLPIELFEEGLNGGKSLLRPAYQLALIALLLKLPKGLPLLGLTTTDFYPDASAESTSVDGHVGRNPSAPGESWSTIRDTADGTNAYDSNTTISCNLRTEYDYDAWDAMARIITLFDTSAIPDTDTISSATMSLYGSSSKANITGVSLALTSSNPTSNTAVVVGDYDTLGTTRYATDISFSSLSTSAYNVWTLNASGILVISKTGVTKLGFRSSNDLDDSEPDPFPDRNTESQLVAYSSDNGSNKPKLSVTYAAAATEFIVTVSETITTTEILARPVNYNKSIAETFSITEALSVLKAVIIDVSESIGITETLNKASAYTKAFSESLSITEALTASQTYLLNLVESISITEALTKVSAFTMSIAESIGITDVLSFIDKFWKELTKHTSSYTGTTKHSSSWTNQDKNTH